MPIHVKIYINEHHLKTVHIGRLEGGTRANDVNTYVAVSREPNEQPDWFGHDAVQYKHVYGDGAEICVSKALGALIDAGHVQRIS